MPAISDRKIEIVRTLVESAPDKIVGGLQRALAETGAESSLAGVRQLVEAEAADRMVRNTVFLPVAGLCVGDGSSANSLTFPARALALIWRGLKLQAPQQVAAAADLGAAVTAAITAHTRPPDPNQTYDGLVAMAAEALRCSDLRDFRAAAELCDRARPRGAATFAACMDIAPVVRRAIPRLPEWTAHPTEDVAAAARLAFEDSVAIDEDAGPRFFDMLAAHIAPPWMVLRVISAVMDKPTERYLGDTELGTFAERVMDDIDVSLKAISRLDLDGGPAAGRAAAKLVGLITEQTFELEVSIELTRDHGWGKRIIEQKHALASVVEARLKDADKLSSACLPIGTGGMARFRKAVPRLNSPVDPKALARAITVLTFAQEIRSFANHGGFSAAHTKAMEKLGGMLDHYVEEVIDIVHGGEIDIAVAQGFLMAAADISGLVRDEKAAELVRRRATAACHGEPPPAAA